MEDTKKFLEAEMKCRVGMEIINFEKKTGVRFEVLVGVLMDEVPDLWMLFRRELGL